MFPTPTSQDVHGQESNLESLWLPSLPALELEAGAHDAGSSRNKSNTLSPSTSTNGRGQAVGQTCQHNHRHFGGQAAASALVQSNIASVMLAASPLRALQIWVDPHAIRRKMARAFVAKLPFPTHMAYISQLLNKDERLRNSLIELAIERTAEQRNFDRAWVLLVRADSLPWEHSNFAKIEADYVEAYEILSTTHDNPITRFMRRLSICSRISLVVSTNRRTDLERLLDQLVAQPATSIPSTPRRRRE